MVFFFFFLAFFGAGGPPEIFFLFSRAGPTRPLKKKTQKNTKFFRVGAPKKKFWGPARRKNFRFFSRLFQKFCFPQRKNFNLFFDFLGVWEKKMPPFKSPLFDPAFWGNFPTHKNLFPPENLTKKAWFFCPLAFF